MTHHNIHHTPGPAAGRPRTSDRYELAGAPSIGGGPGISRRGLWRAGWRTPRGAAVGHLFPFARATSASNKNRASSRRAPAPHLGLPPRSPLHCESPHPTTRYPTHIRSLRRLRANSPQPAASAFAVPHPTSVTVAPPDSTIARLADNSSTATSSDPCGSTTQKRHGSSRCSASLPARDREGLEAVYSDT